MPACCDEADTAFESEPDCEPDPAPLWDGARATRGAGGLCPTGMGWVDWEAAVVVVADEGSESNENSIGTSSRTPLLVPMTVS